MQSPFVAPGLGWRAFSLTVGIAVALGHAPHLHAAADCYGALAYSGDGATAIAQDTHFAAGALYGSIPVLWQDNILTVLPQALEASTYAVLGVGGSANAPYLAGRRQVGLEPNYTSFAVAWGGVGLPVANLHPAGFVASEALTAWSDGTSFAAGGYAVEVGGREIPIRWGADSLTLQNPSISLLGGGTYGGRVLAVKGLINIGYQDVLLTRYAVSWTEAGPTQFPFPEPADAYTGSKAVAIDQAIVGSVTKEGKEHAAVWVVTPFGIGAADMHPAEGYESSAAVATSGNFVVGVGRDTAGMDQVLLWELPEKAPKVLTSSVPAPFGSVRPTSVDAAGNVSVATDFGSFLLVPGASGLRELRYRDSGKTNAQYEVVVLPTCEGGTVSVDVYTLGGEFVSNWSAPFEAGSSPLTFPVSIEGLQPASTYRARAAITRPSGDRLFGPTLPLYTKAANLPPHSPPREITYRPGQQRIFTTAELLAGVVDPEGDPIQIEEFRSDNPGLFEMTEPPDQTWIWNPPSNFKEEAHFQLIVRDDKGARGYIEIRGVLPTATKPAKGAWVLMEGQDQPTFTFLGEADVVYVIQYTDTLVEPVPWQNLGAVSAGADGIIAVNDPDAAGKSGRYYRAVSN